MGWSVEDGEVVEGRVFEEGRLFESGMDVLGGIVVLNSAAATASARMDAASAGLAFGALRVMKENVGAIVVCRWAGEGVKWL